MDFQILTKIEFYWRQIFEILNTHKPSLGSYEIRREGYCLLFYNEFKDKMLTIEIEDGRALF